MPAEVESNSTLSAKKPASKSFAIKFRIGLLLGALIGAGFFFIVQSIDTSDDRQKCGLSVAAHDLPNFHKVTDYLYRGGKPSPLGLIAVHKLGVKTVIDLRTNEKNIAEERKMCGLLGINYISLPTGDFQIIPAHNKVFLQTVSEAAKDPAKGPVFIHCSYGSDRTGFMCALWRVEHDQWSWPQAFSEALKRGFFFHRFQT